MGRIDFSKKIKKIVKKRFSYIKYILKKRNALHLSDNTIKDVSDSSSAKIAIHFHIIYIDLILPQAGFIGYAAGLFAYVFIGSYGLSHAAVISAGIFHSL